MLTIINLIFPLYSLHNSLNDTFSLHNKTSHTFVYNIQSCLCKTLSFNATPQCSIAEQGTLEPDQQKILDPSVKKKTPLFYHQIFVLTLLKKFDVNAAVENLKQTTLTKPNTYKIIEKEAVFEVQETQ